MATLKTHCVWILVLFFILVGVHPSLVFAGDEIYFYDTFDDGVIDTNLWGVSGPVSEYGGSVVLGTEGTIAALKEDLIGMWFSAIGYQDIDIGEHVNIHLTTQTPAGDIVIVGIYCNIEPPDEPDDPPFIQNYVFCQWYEDGVIDPEHLHHVDLVEAQWGTTYIFGLEYTIEGSILVWVNGQVVYSFSVPGVDIGYSQGGAEFWFKADSVEGGNVTAELDWAEAIDIEGPTVEIIGPQPPTTVLYNPVHKSPKVLLDTQVEPPGGEYEWEILAGHDKVRFVGNIHSETLVVQGIAPSEEIGDVIIKVSYWVDSQSCEDIYSLTVQKPTFLEIAQGPLTEVEYNENGQVIYYLTSYWFQVMDQLGPSAQPINYKGMTVLEEREVFCNNYKTGPIKKKIKGKTNNLGVIRDDLAPPQSPWLYPPIPTDLLIKVNQTIKVEGWYVGLRCQTYYYDHATSEDGICGPCE
jgi:hypothetical protein